MKIRRATEKDIPKVRDLLSQVLELHAEIRPDIFIPGTTKYTSQELLAMFQDDQKPVYVAVDEDDAVIGYAFCALREQPFSNNMIPFKSLFIDDLCVDQSVRGQSIGRKLFEYVKSEAVRLGCYEVTLNVWEGNDSARHFYEKMGMKPKETQMEFILPDK
ncbi:MAG: GNAT family N-acetyltransferase [Blautia sp.]|nr:GNAT family N-acetyltransferase [Blautia sp.]